MGVTGLWDLIRPVATKTSLAALGRDAFLANRNGLRAFVIGIDASIWIFHAQATQAGSNPFLRTLFYKISTLLQHPVLPVFVFDGPNKPVVKRNQRVIGHFGTDDPHSVRFKQLLDACGLEWWNAPGEAEAELALMNRQGKIDAVLSDDVDALLFGATCVLRNNSPTLPGTNGNNTRTELRYYDMFRSCDIRDAWAKEGSALRTEDDCQNAMVLIAMLAGGDYVPEGIGGLGPNLALGLAHAGVSNFFKLYTKDKATFDIKMSTIHRFMVNELRTNDSGFMGRKNGTRAARLDGIQPSEVFKEFSLDAYLRPARSPDDPTLGWPGLGKGDPTRRGRATFGGRWTLESCARACEQFFEWGTLDGVRTKFSKENNMFGAEVAHDARQFVLAADKRKGRRKSSLSRLSMGGASPERITAFFSNQEFRRASLPFIQGGAPEHLVKVVSSRPSPVCDGMTDLRLAFKVEPYADRCRKAMDGTRVDTREPPSSQLDAVDATETTTAAPKDEVRTWIPDYLVRAAWPSLAEDHDAVVAAKAAKAAATPKKKQGRPKKAVAENAAAFESYFRQAASDPAPVPAHSQLSALSDTLGSLSVVSPTPVRRRPDQTPLFDPAPDSPLSSPCPSPSPPARRRGRPRIHPLPAASPLPASPRGRGRPRTVPGSPPPPPVFGPLRRAGRPRDAVPLSPVGLLDAVLPPKKSPTAKAKSRSPKRHSLSRTRAVSARTGSRTIPADADIIDFTASPLSSPAPSLSPSPSPPASASHTAPPPTLPTATERLALAALDSPPLVDHEKRARLDSSPPSRCTTPKPAASASAAPSPAPRPRKSPKKKKAAAGNTAAEAIVLSDSDDATPPPPLVRRGRGRPRKVVSPTPSPSPARAGAPAPLSPTATNVPVTLKARSPTATAQATANKSAPKSTSPTTNARPTAATKLRSPTLAHAHAHAPRLATQEAAAIQSTLDTLIAGPLRRRGRPPKAKPVESPAAKPVKPKYTIELDDDGVEVIYVGGK